MRVVVVATGFWVSALHHLASMGVPHLVGVTASRAAPSMATLLEAIAGAYGLASDAVGL